MDRKIKIFDTTLRDGEQSPGCTMNLEEKLEVARQLEKLKVDVIEAGFAVSSQADFEAVKAIASTVKNCTVASLARAVEKDIDAAFQAVKAANAPRVHLFLSTSPVHMKYKLRMSPEEVLENIASSVAYCKKYLSDVEFSAEDAMRTEPEFLARVVETAIRSGATVINIPDTVGFVTPTEMFERISFLKNTVPNIDLAEISVHCHNDLGMAVANSLEAVRAGASQIECTINGIGERAGNASLEEVVMALKTRRPFYEADTRIETTQLYRTSKLVYNIIGMPVPINKPIVGTNAFAHESGIHQHGVLAEKSTYEIMTPESVGLSKNTMVLGKHSGRHGFEQRLSELGYSFSPEKINEFFEQFKTLCGKKKNVTDLDIEAIVNNSITQKTGVYTLEQFEVHAGNQKTASCVIKLSGNDGSIEEVAMGDGPIDAAYNAIDKIVGVTEHLLDTYTINAVSEGNDAQGEVIVKLKKGERFFTGRGLSTDIIESSILAYVNAVNKMLEAV